jgi:NAD(P)-dependent dehydrogenase (short-subunit alcohol dehydrogenase family)
MELDGKVAIVTGASRGMGREIAKALASKGVQVALVGLNPDRLQRVAQEISNSGGQAISIPTDVRSLDLVERMVATVLEYYGTIDILVNCAFWGPPASIEDTTEEFWDRTIDTTLKGPFLCTRAVAPTMQMKRSGRIVNIGSKAGKVGEDNRTAYCAAKWGLEGLTAALVEEMGRYNVHVHLISPAATYTPWWREVGANLTPQVIERMVPSEVVAQAVVWVLSLPDQVDIPDIPLYNYKNPFEGKKSPFES